MTHSVYAQLSQIYTRLDFFCAVILRQAQYSSKEAKDMIKGHFMRDQVEGAWLYHLIRAYFVAAKDKNIASGGNEKRL